MFSESFEYHAPSSLQEAVGLLGQYGDDAKVISGGMSLIPLMKLRLTSITHLIDLRNLSDLEGISEAGGNIVIGARATHYSLESSSLLQSKCPLVAQTAARVGDVQVRNKGTIGGSLVHADPAADLPAAMVALDAQMTLSGKSERTVAAKDFFVDVMTSSINADEILTKITVPATGKNTAYFKMSHPASGFAMVGVAVVLEMSGNSCSSARIGVTGASSAAFRASSVEGALAGHTLDAAKIKEAAAQVASDLKEPLEDPLNAGAEYRVQLAKVYTERAISAAVG